MTRKGAVYRGSWTPLEYKGHCYTFRAEPQPLKILTLNGYVCSFCSCLLLLRQVNSKSNPGFFPAGGDRPLSTPVPCTFTFKKPPFSFQISAVLFHSTTLKSLLVFPSLSAHLPVSGLTNDRVMWQAREWKAADESRKCQGDPWRDKPVSVCLLAQHYFPLPLPWFCPTFTSKIKLAVSCWVSPFVHHLNLQSHPLLTSTITFYPW